jgi:hypothetical protein
VPIATGDLKHRLSGGAGNTSANASLGGAMSTAAGGVITDNAANNLWDDVSGDEAAAGDVEYRGFYAENAHASLTWLSPVYWISSLTSSADTEFDVAVAAEAAGVSMASIADEQTAPTGVTFSRPTTKGAGLVLGDIAHNSFRGLWTRRTVTAGAAAANDTGTIRTEGDSNP